MAENTKWLEVEEVQRQIGIAAEALAQRTRENYITHVSGMLQLPNYVRIESPLEAIFYAWWDAVTWDTDTTMPTRLHLRHQVDVTANGNAYRLDFVVGLADHSEIKRFADAGRPFPMIAVEVDGHAFHEKTREQVAIRNQRDRDLQQDGWKVFHYSWSEVIQNGARAVGGVVDCAVSEWMACDRAALDKWYAEHPEEKEKLMDRIKNAFGS